MKYEYTESNFYDCGTPPPINHATLEYLFERGWELVQILGWGAPAGANRNWTVYLKREL